MAVQTVFSNLPLLHSTSAVPFCTQLTRKLKHKRQEVKFEEYRVNGSIDSPLNIINPHSSPASRLTANPKIEEYEELFQT